MKSIRTTSPLRLTIFLALILGMSSATYAQDNDKKSSTSNDLLILPEVGMNFSNYKYTTDQISLNTKDRVSIRLGVSADIRLRGSIFLEPGIFYAGNGFNFTGDNGNGGNGTLQVKVNAIQIPVIFKYCFESRKHNVFFVGIGPSFTFNMSGTGHVDDGAGTVIDKNLTFGNSADDYLKKLDIGISTEIGFKFKKGVFVKISGILEIQVQTHLQVSVVLMPYSLWAIVFRSL
jgi:Outer membrane protein beta-barrel domain